jgi:hypothetical protein
MGQSAARGLEIPKLANCDSTSQGNPHSQANCSFSQIASFKMYNKFAKLSEQLCSSAIMVVRYDDLC